MKVFLLNMFDYQTTEFVPVGVVSKDVKEKIISHKPLLKDHFLEYELDELDWKTIEDYRFNIKKGDLT